MCNKVCNILSWKKIINEQQSMSMYANASTLCIEKGTKLYTAKSFYTTYYPIVI